jgi:outer membrane protein
MRFFALLPWILLGTTSAEGIAVIDSERIFESMGDVVDATELLNEEIEGWEAHSDSLQDEIDAIQYDLDYTMVMSPERRSEREELLETRTVELQTFLEQVFGPGGLVESRNSQLVSPIVASINEAVRLISQEEGYDLVLDTSGGLVVYAAGSVDITDRVLEELSGRGVD